MDLLHIRADRNAVKAGDLGREESALKAAVDDLDDCLLSGHAPVDLRCQVPEGGFLDQLPGGIGSLGHDCRAELVCDAVDPVHDHLFAGVDAGPHQGVGPNALLRGPDDPQAEGSPGDIPVQGRIFDDAVGKGHEEADHAAAVFAGEGHVMLCPFHGPVVFSGPSRLDPDIRIGHAVFIGDLLRERGDSILDGAAPDLFSGEDQFRPCIARDGIVPGSAVHADNGILSFLLQAVQKAGQEEVGIGPAGADALSGMSAAQAADGDLQDLSLLFAASARQGADLFRPACAGGCDEALLLGVQIDQPAALKCGEIQNFSPQKAHFLIHRKNAFQRRAYEGLVRQERQHDRYGDAVVTAQGRPVRPEPLPVCLQGDGLFFHIDGIGFFFLTDHIDVALQGNGGSLLATG